MKWLQWQLVRQICVLSEIDSIYIRLITHNFTIHTPWMYYDFYFLIFRYNFIAGKLLRFLLFRILLIQSSIEWVFMSFLHDSKSGVVDFDTVSFFRERRWERGKSREKELSIAASLFRKCGEKHSAFRSETLTFEFPHCRQRGCWGIARKRVTHFSLSCEYHVHVSLEITITSWVGM